MIEGLETVSKIIARFVLVEKLYLDDSTLETYGPLKDQLILLYAYTLRYLATAKRYYLLNTPSKTIRSIPATIVIDAIDECDHTKRHLLLSALERIVAESQNIVKVLVSSREEADITAYLGQHNRIHVSNQQNNRDIDNFIEIQVGIAINTKRMLLGTVSCKLRQEIVSVLKTKARRMLVFGLHEYAS